MRAARRIAAGAPRITESDVAPLEMGERADERRAAPLAWLRWTAQDGVTQPNHLGPRPRGRRAVAA